jgi:hypothetical protein
MQPPGESPGVVPRRKDSRMLNTASPLQLRGLQGLTPCRDHLQSARCRLLTIRLIPGSQPDVPEPGLDAGPGFSMRGDRLN